MHHQYYLPVRQETEDDCVGDDHIITHGRVYGIHLEYRSLRPYALEGVVGSRDLASGLGEVASSRSRV